MSALQAMAVGARRALASPLILLALWIVNLAVAVPAAWTVATSIDDTIGKSRADEDLLAGMDLEWYDHYSADARGVAATFKPSVVGAGAFYDNLEAMFDGSLVAGPGLLLGSGVVFGLVWLWLLGGTLDRFADRETRVGPSRFRAACGSYFFRFLRLAVLSVALYAGVLWLMRVVFGWMERATKDVNVEGTIFFYGVLIWGGAALLITLIHASFGFAKVATVVEGRRSMLLAAVRGFVFVFANPGKALGLYYGVLAIAGVALAAYALVAPDAGQRTYEEVVRAFAVGQGFLLLKLFLRLSLLAGQTALYRTHGMRAPEPETVPATPE